MYLYSRTINKKSHRSLLRGDRPRPTRTAGSLSPGRTYSLITGIILFSIYCCRYSTFVASRRMAPRCCSAWEAPFAFCDCTWDSSPEPYSSSDGENLTFFIFRRLGHVNLGLFQSSDDLLLHLGVSQTIRDFFGFNLELTRRGREEQQELVVSWWVESTSPGLVSIISLFWPSVASCTARGCPQLNKQAMAG